MKYLTFFLITLFIFNLQNTYANPIKQETSNLNIICEDDFCPSNVGALVSSSFFGPSFCRATLIDDQHVMTNAHCVERFLKDESCEEKVYVKFADQIGSCKSIEYYDYQFEKSNKPDVAIIALVQPMNIEPAKIKRTGFKDNQPLHYWKTQYELSKDQVTLKRVNCKAKKYSAGAGRFFSKYPTTIAMKDCPMENGDSGSPIFNNKNQVVAVLQGGLDLDVLDIFKRIPVPGFNNDNYLSVLGQYYSPRESKEVKFNVTIAATTLTCMDTALIPGKTVCRDNDANDYMNELIDKIEKSFIKKIKKINKTSSIQWEVPQDSFDQLRPNGEETSLQEITPQDFQSIISARAFCKNGGILSPPPSIQITSTTDSYFRMDLEVKEITPAITTDVNSIAACK